MRTHHLRLAALPAMAPPAIRVAVIDSGVHASHPHVQSVAGGVGIDDLGREHDDYVDRLGHGTAVAAAIREKAPQAELICAKVFDRSLAATAAALVAALRWARQREARLINLSLGTANPAHEAALAPEIEAAVACGIVVVAAAPDAATRWLPGALPAVVRVSLDMSIPRHESIVLVADDRRVTMRCSGYPRPVPGVSPERNLRGLSFAVANATGLLARVLADAPGDSDLQAALAGISSTSPSG